MVSTIETVYSYNWQFSRLLCCVVGELRALTCYFYMIYKYPTRVVVWRLFVHRCQQDARGPPALWWTFRTPKMQFFKGGLLHLVDICEEKASIPLLTSERGILLPNWRRTSRTFQLGKQYIESEDEEKKSSFLAFLLVNLAGKYSVYLA